MKNQPASKAMIVKPDDDERIDPPHGLWVQGRGDLRMEFADGRILTMQFNEPDTVLVDEDGNEKSEEPSAVIPTELLGSIIRIFRTGTTVTKVAALYQTYSTSPTKVTAP